MLPLPILPGKLKTDIAFTLTEMMLCLLLVAVLALLFFGAGRSLSRHQQQTVCLNNMRQLGQKIIHWSVENGGRLLPVNERITPWGSRAEYRTWMMILHDAGYFETNWQNRERTVLRCPVRENLPRLTTNFDAKMGAHYGMNPYPGFDARVMLMGDPYRRAAQVARPSQTMLLGEVQYAYQIPSDPTSRVHIYPHPVTPEGMNLVFMDGHALHWKGRLPDPTNAEDPYPWY